MMTELVEIKENVDVFQSILVVDAMTGQDAVNVAKEFNEKVGVDGIIITKMDGDTRGGAALSIRSVTGKPIFICRYGRKTGRSSAVLSRPNDKPNPWYGRCIVTDRESRADDQ